MKKALLKKSNTSNLLIITLFFLSIILPLIFSDKVGGKISSIENRYLASFPTTLSVDKIFSHETRTGLENWIKDNVGGRELALLIKDTISYRLFHVFPWQDVIEGKESWLYLLPNYDIPNYSNTNVPTKDALAWIKDNYTRITKNFKDMGIEFTVMIWPFKYDIYPEFMPNTLNKVNGESAIDYLDRELSNNVNFDFNTAAGTLRHGKQEQSVYYKAYDSSHWNQFGAFLAYTELMNRVKMHLPDLRILNENDFTITSTKRVTKTSWGFFTDEEDLRYEIKGGYHAHSDPSFFNTFNYVSKDPYKSYNYYENPDDSLPRAVIVGDSMIWEFMLPNLSESFSELVFIHFFDMSNLDSVINIVKPDIVIMAARGSGVAQTFATYQYTQSKSPYAKILADTTPLKVEPGRLYEINITVENIGNVTWNEGKKIRLCIFVDGHDSGYRISIPNGMEVKPGEIYNFILKGFHTEKNTVLEYQMVEDGVSYFGERKRVEIAIQ